jgi:hypothetical protein
MEEGVPGVVLGAEGVVLAATDVLAGFRQANQQ